MRGVHPAFPGASPPRKDFFNTGAVAGRTEFEYICSICGANPDESPLVSDAVLGVAVDGKKFLPICEDCQGMGLGRKLRIFGKVSQPKAQASKRTARKAAGRGRGRGRGRGGGRGKSGKRVREASSEESSEESSDKDISGGGRAAKRARSSGAGESSDSESELVFGLVL